MEQVLVIDAVRTPLARRNGGLSGIHPARLLAGILDQLLRRTGVDHRTGHQGGPAWASPAWPRSAPTVTAAPTTWPSASSTATASPPSFSRSTPRSIRRSRASPN